MKLQLLPTAALLLLTGLGTVTYVKRQEIRERFPSLRPVSQRPSIPTDRDSLIDGAIGAFSSLSYLQLDSGLIDGETHRDYARYLYRCQTERSMPLGLEDWLECGAPVWED